MSRSQSLLALLIAPWFAGCAGPIVCPDGRDADGVACVCVAPYVEGDDGECVARIGASPSTARDRDDFEGRGAGGMRDGGLDLDATLIMSASEPSSCAPDAGCADAGPPDASR